MDQRVEKANCDLQRHFAELERTVPNNERQECTFTSASFAELPGILETDKIVIRKGHVNYDDARVDRLQFFASKSTYRELGLLILSVVFRSGGSRVHVTLTEPSSAIRNLVVEYRGNTTRLSGHETIPQKFTFYPQQIETHPWTRQNPDVFGFPRFALTNMRQFVVSEEDWTNRDTVMGFGNDDVSVRFADLLLNFGSPQNEINEVVLEGEGGFRGVGVHSAEAAFYLPGSLAWPEGVELSHLFDQ
ncbi:MAG TPA: hypothetical protein VFK06_00215 [Candidatus Angelobacter sp.]|nr:hypothetical protein [Candidatus Angelobacter sp.]